MNGHSLKKGDQKVFEYHCAFHRYSTVEIHTEMAWLRLSEKDLA